MSYNIGTAEGIIRMRYNGEGVKQAEDDLRGLGNAGEDAGRRSTEGAGRMAAAGLAITAGLGAAINSAANFEQRLSAIEAVSGATGEQMEKVSDLALRLGADTSFSATEAASAIEELTKAGISLPDVLNGAADAAVALAEAGEISLPEAATIASNAMNQFNLAAEDLPKVADQIAGAANASAIDVGDFGQSLQQVGAVANLAGVDFEDAATAIALLGNAGIKGSDAGTSLKSMFQNLQPTTMKQTELFRELGLLTEDGANKFYDAQGSLKGLSDVAGILQNSLQGMTDQQKQATLEAIFGSDAIRAAAILANEGSKGFDNMAKSMGKVTAADVAATRMDNFKGSVEELMGSLETLMIQIGTPLLGALRAVVDIMSSAVDAFVSLPGPIKTAIGVFAAVAGPALLAAAAFSFFTAAAASAGGVLALIGGPITLVIAAIAALVAAFVYFYQTNETFRTFVQEIGALLRDVLGRALAELPGIMRTVGDLLNRMWEGAQPSIQTVVDVVTTLVEAFMGLWPTIRDTAKSIGDNLVQAFQDVAPKIMPLIDSIEEFVSAFWDVAGPIISSLGELVGWLVSTFGPAFIEVFGNMANTAIDVLGPLVSGVIDVVTGLFDFLTGIFDLIKAIMDGDWGAAWEAIKSIAQASADMLVGLIQGLLGALVAIFQNNMGILIGVVQAIWSGIRAVIGAILGGIIAVIRAQLSIAVGTVRAIWNVIRNIFMTVLTAILANVRTVWNGITGAIRAAIAVVSGVVRAGLGVVRGIFSTVWGAVRSAVSTAWNGIREAVSNGIGRLISLVTGLPGQITGAIGNLGSLLYNKGREIIQGLINGLESMLSTLRDRAERVMDTIGRLLPGSPVRDGPLKVLNNGYAGKQIVQMVIDGINMMNDPLRYAFAGLEADASAGTPAAGATAAPSRPSEGGPSRGLRLLDGRLTLDESGRAFIDGVATDRDDDDDDYDDTLGRMNP